MSDDGSSYRQILRSTTIVGGASAINILLSLGRMKAAALLLGPAGVGLIGLLSTLIGVAISIFGLGLGAAGTKQIAEAVSKNDNNSVAVARVSLFWCSLSMAILGSIIFWLLRDVIAEKALGDITKASEVGWLSLAVGLHVMAGFQGGSINGLRRIGDFSRINIYSAIFSSVVGVTSLLLWGTAGVILYVGAVPFFTFLIGYWYVAKLPKVNVFSFPFSVISENSNPLFRLGTAFMLVSSIGYAGQFLVRSLVQNEFDIESLGYFQAASAISITYIGFLITAIGQDYYPRLTEIVSNKQNAADLVNEQIEVSLLLAGPIVLAMMAIAPWVIELLYSSKFHQAAVILRWQIIGDVLKIAAWPMLYVLLAIGDGRSYVKIEIINFISIGFLTFILLPVFGIAGSGVSFLLMNAIMFFLVWIKAKQHLQFKLNNTIIKQIVFLMLSLIALLCISLYSADVTAIIGLGMSIASAIYGFICISHKTKLNGSLGRMALRAEIWLKKAGIWHE